MKNAFGELFDQNEYVYELTREKLTGQIVESTGAAKEDRTTKAIVGTFLALKDLADFEGDVPDKLALDSNSDAASSVQGHANYSTTPPIANPDSVQLRVGYTINLNLPETNDPEVFDAIFKSLRDNLLTN